MNLNKQFINLIGAVLVLAIIVAGVALITVPMWSQAQTTDASTRTVVQTNSTYQAQIDQLSAVDTEVIDANLAALHTQIAPFNRLDDVFTLIDAAADKRELVLESAIAADAEPFAPRAAVVEEAPEAAPPASADETADTTEVAAPTETPAPAPDETNVQQQVVVTIKVPVPDAKTATAFVDDLRVGPRLISIIDATLEADSAMLTVTALAFIRTED